VTVTPKTRRDAIRAYRKGATVREVAAEHGVHEHTIRRWLAADDVERRRGGPRGRTDVTDAEIVEGRAAGMTWLEIADSVGMSKTGVRMRWLAIHGEPRPERA
jgi:transposase-like protein